jgi:hypothetical protein
LHLPATDRISNGPRRVIVESIVYQPERAGRFDL